MRRGEMLMSFSVSVSLGHFPTGWWLSHCCLCFYQSLESVSLPLAEAHRPNSASKLLCEVTAAEHCQISQGKQIQVLTLKLEHRLTTASGMQLLRGLPSETQRTLRIEVTLFTISQQPSLLTTTII